MAKKEGQKERSPWAGGQVLTFLIRVNSVLSAWQGTPYHGDPAFQQFAKESDMKGQLQVSHKLDLKRSSIYFTWKKERRKEAEGLAGLQVLLDRPWLHGPGDEGTRNPLHQWLPWS